MAETDVVCNTPGCENEGVVIRLELSGVDPDTGAVFAVDVVQCGPCGGQITDLREVFSDG